MGTAADALKPTPANTYPQIVRVSYVDGDVRLSRRAVDQKASQSDWEKVVAGVPLETGYSLVTGTGRAEIEFEDASTAYVGENSVVVFNNLITANGVPLTDLGLLSGVVTVHVTPIAPGEEFLVETPAAGITLRYPNRTYLRLNSYLDGMLVTPLGKEMTMRVGNSSAVRTRGQTLEFRYGRWMNSNVNPGDFTEWDKWVQDRVTARKTAMLAAMKASGLTTPIPGLVEMNEAGSFFPCEPYGTCWAPTNGWGPEAVAGQEEGEVSAGRIAGARAQAVVGSGVGGATRLVSEDEDYFPCSPWLYRSWYQKDLVTHKKRFLYTEQVGDGAGYEWGVCHAGSWIHREGRYAWVSGEKRHHHCPVRWVKNGKNTGFVPIHPRDVAGKPPLNLKHAVFQAGERKDASAQRVTYEAGKDLKLLDGTPKEFRKDDAMPLEKAETPRMEAYSLRDTVFVARPGEPGKMPGSSIAFDHKSQSFMLARSVTVGGKATTVSMPIVGRVGGMQAGGPRGLGGGVGPSFSRGSYAGGSASGGGGGSSGGGARGGGGSSGGGARGGGGSSGGGGGGRGASGGGGGGGGSHGGGGGGGGGGGSHK